MHTRAQTQVTPTRQRLRVHNEAFAVDLAVVGTITPFGENILDLCRDM